MTLETTLRPAMSQRRQLASHLIDPFAVKGGQAQATSGTAVHAGKAAAASAGLV